MKLKFSIPPVHSEVKFFPNFPSFALAVRRTGGFFLWDRGASLPGEGDTPEVLSLAGGELGKNWSELGKILEILAERRHERGTPLFVVGGGAVMDLGALAASLYRRGIPLVLVPTTLLGMVDAAVGGKTAVDLARSEGFLKNIAGTFYPAREVWIAPHFLGSLPRRERLSGAGEAWKSLWIAGAKMDRKTLFDFVEKGTVGKEITKIVKQCLELKIRVVQSDPLDTKRRREILNFGHTVGHVLEACGGVSHGEAVLWGMATETLLLGKKGEFMLAEILAVLKELALDIPEAFSRLDVHQSLLLADKKVKAGMLELSVLARPGKIVKLKSPPEKIAETIRIFPEFFRHASGHLRA